MHVLDATDAHPAEASDVVPTPTSSPQRPAAISLDGPMREFLAWVARCQRTEADAMAAWRSTCPRYTVWEDALNAELIHVERGNGRRFGEAQVTLTPRGQAALAGP